jgi:DNA-binding transcriptional LysR family regulator
MPFRRGHLDYFVTVAEEGQITRAAAKLQIAQPTPSQAIAQLEAEVGLRLLQRDSRGVTLTIDGRRFFEKARRAVAADADAVHMAESLARAEQGTIAFGFVGAPPGLDSPGILEAFAEAHPDIDIRYQELPFPFTPTAHWLSEVDVAVCHVPAADHGVWAQALRLEPRIVLAPKRHSLADRTEVTVAEVLDESFIGFHPSVEPTWAGFWSLDDYRGGPPGRITADRAANAQEVLAALAVRDAITTVPAAVAALIPSVLTGMVAIPLRDAEPSVIELVGHADRRGPPVGALIAFAEDLLAEAASGRLHAGA